MKILIVSPMPPQPQAPSAIPLVLHAQLTGLIPRHEVTLVTVAGPEPHEWAALDYLRALPIDVHAVRRTEPCGFARWKRRRRWARCWLRGYPWHAIWFWEPAVQQSLDRLLTEKAFDLVTVEDSAMGIYRYHTRAPIVFTEHEVRRPRPLSWPDDWHANWIQWALGEVDWHRWPRYQGATWRRFDCIQTFTPRDAAAICTMAPEVAHRVRVNPFGIDLPEPTDPSREEKGLLIFVGNFTHLPNVDGALWLGHEIMPRLRAQCPGIRLTIVGSFPPKSVQALSCDDITVTGRVPRVEPLLERATLIVAPLRVGGGQRMKVLQGMAMGKAVVTTPRGADGLEFYGGPVPLAIAADAEGFAHLAASLLAADETRRELGRRARAFVAQYYSAAAYARRLETIYAEVQSAKVTVS